jgi:hypothetical protein
MAFVFKVRQGLLAVQYHRVQVLRGDIATNKANVCVFVAVLMVLEL